MTKVKICGLTRTSDIETVNNYKPDYIGFVFADFSKRYVSPEEAFKLKQMLIPEIKAVGVFVNEKQDSIISILSKDIIDIVQLHGDEDEDYILSLKAKVSCPIIKVFNMNDFAETDDFGIIEKCCADYVMIDSGYGTGKTFDWSKPGRIKRPFFLAGGLSIENVSEAIKKLQPYAVDISSGVETDGFKDSEKISKFIQNVRNNK